VPRPSVPRRSISRPRPPKAAGDLWFRFVTRLRAGRYWFRERSESSWEGAKRAAEAVAYWWSKRSTGARIRIFSVAGIVVLYLVIKFLPVPGVPCEISAAKECAPSNDTIAYVPRNASLYVHVTVNSSSHQWELARDLRGELGNFTALLQGDTSSLTPPGGHPIDLARQVLPWAKDDLALLGVPGPKQSTPEAYIVGVGDQAKATQFLAALAPPEKSKQAKVGGATATVYSSGFATAHSGDQVLFGNVGAVRAGLLAKAGGTPRLEDGPQDAAREALPNVRIAEVYLSRAGVLRLLAPRQGTATQLNTFVDYGATTGLAASMRIRDDGVEINLVSELDRKLEQASPTVFAALPEFTPSLADQAGAESLGYVGVGDLGPALTRALATAGKGAQGLVGSLQALGQRLKQQAGVNPLQDLLPALGGQAALVAEPTGGLPNATLIVDGVDEKKATAALASLQQPLLSSLATQGGPQVPSFQSSDVDGVTVHSVQISPSVDLSYAIFDDKLVVSTQPAGIAQVRSGGATLSGTPEWEDATTHLPSSVSALVFLNLHEVVGLLQQAGLAENPLYASLAQDITHLRSLGLAVRGSENELRSDLFIAIHD
jgi:uncharacterized protein DUF3352